MKNQTISEPVPFTEREKQRLIRMYGGSIDSFKQGIGDRISERPKPRTVPVSRPVTKKVMIPALIPEPRKCEICERPIVNRSKQARTCGLACEKSRTLKRQRERQRSGLK